MKKQNLIFAFIVLMVGNVIGQSNSFVKTFGSSKKDYPISIEVGHYGDIVIGGSEDITATGNNRNGVLYLLDSTASIKKKLVVSDSLPFVNFYDISVTDSGYAFFGYKQRFDFPSGFHLIMLETNKDLSIQNQKEYFMGNNRYLHYSDAFIDANGSYVHCGQVVKPNHTVSSFVLKTHKDYSLDTAKVGMYNDFIGGTNYSIMQDFNNKGYYLSFQTKTGGGGYRILHLNKNLGLISDTLKMVNETYGINHAEKLGQDKILYTSDGKEEKQYYVVCIDTLNAVHFYREYGNNNIHDLPLKEALSIKNNSIFVTSFSIPNIYVQYFPSDTNRIFVQKMDTSFNVQWERKLGWGAYHIQYGIEATNDGGCVVLGSVYDSDTMNLRHDIVLFKLDENGNITGKQELKEMASSVKIFPNPGEKYFYIEATPDMEALLAYDKGGRKIFQKKLMEGRNKIDMTSFAKGVYFFQILNAQGQVANSAKWIKK